jgi:hypothetical protein
MVLLIALEPKHFGLARAPTRGYSGPLGTKISVPKTYPRVPAGLNLRRVYPPIQGPASEIPAGTPVWGGVQANWPPPQTRNTRGYFQGGPWTIPDLPVGLWAPEELSRSPKPSVYPDVRERVPALLVNDVFIHIRFPSIPITLRMLLSHMIVIVGFISFFPFVFHYADFMKPCLMPLRLEHMRERESCLNLGPVWLPHYMWFGRPLWYKLPPKPDCHTTLGMSNLLEFNS